MSICCRLAVAYAVNVVEKGVACCDHTCNNPLLHQMVVNILSLPGVISPEMAAAFRAAVEQSAGKDLDEEVRERWPPSSGAPWWASLLVLFWVGLFGLGASMGGRKREP